jgi:hypothetical protein
MLKEDKNNRLDYMFSYWILSAYFLFYFQVISYNPKHILILGVIFNTIQFIVFLWHKIAPIRLLRFILFNSCIKLIPLYTIRKTTVTKKDDIFYLGLLFVYIIWLYINDIGIKEIHKIYFQYKEPILLK